MFEKAKSAKHVAVLSFPLINFRTENFPQNTGCPDRCGLRNVAVTGMFQVYRSHQRLPWDYKGGRKLLLALKYPFMDKMMSQGSGQKKKQIWIW